LSLSQEEARLRTRQAKEDLEKFLQFLLLAPEMTSMLRFKKAEKLFEDVVEWQEVKERDRKDIFEDVQHEVAKREKVDEYASVISNGSSCQCGQSRSIKVIKSNRF